MDEYNAKFSGAYISLPDPLQLGSEIIYRGNGTVTNEIRKDMQDGAVMTVYTIRPIFAELTLAEHGIPKAPITKDFAGTKSISKRIRNALYIYWKQQLSNKYPDFEAYYEAWGEKQLAKIQEEIV